MITVYSQDSGSVGVGWFGVLVHHIMVERFLYSGLLSTQSICRLSCRCTEGKVLQCYFSYPWWSPPYVCRPHTQYAYTDCTFGREDSSPVKKFGSYRVPWVINSVAASSLSSIVYHFGDWQASLERFDNLLGVGRIPWRWHVSCASHTPWIGSFKTESDERGKFWIIHMLFGAGFAFPLPRYIRALKHRCRAGSSGICISSEAWDCSFRIVLIGWDLGGIPYPSRWINGTPFFYLSMLITLKLWRVFWKGYVATWIMWYFMLLYEWFVYS